MAIVTGDRYLDLLVKFVEKQAGPLLDGTLVLKLNPVGLHYVQTRLEQLQELEGLLAGAPVDYLRAYISDLGDHRALEQLRRILRLLPSLKVVSVLPQPARDPTPLSLLPFGRLRFLELRGCDLSTSAARGLLELRHTLEKIICHNSTDALRHVFASRIVDIKDSPMWNKLSFVSCACNGLVLMDESLQLLPVVETLDLSRNQFAKVDNLRKCTKLSHLDLGFNHLRTIASLSEVACPIIKLVLRNNALTTLRGIENLKFVEGLDISYNIISSFSELELVGTLSSLRNLWMEGNPICCARWYRPHVFSFFTNPEKLKLDERGMSTRESWKRQIILASRQRRPAGYGFYSPAKDGSDEGSFNTKRRKLSRLACIEDDEQRSFYGSEALDQDSISCDSVNLRRDENALSDGEAEIVGLMNRVEFMKKERSVLWLREFREWMDKTSGDVLDDSNFACLSPGKGKNRRNSRAQQHLGESSRYVSDSVQDSGDESSTIFLESDISFTDASIGFHGREYFNSNSNATLESPMIYVNQEGTPKIDTTSLEKEDRKALPPEKLNKPHENLNLFLLDTTNSSGPTTSAVEVDDRIDAKVNMTSLIAIDEIMESRSSSIQHGSPPHYQEDILHRRHNLEEEFLQLSAESYSLASSDSDTSCGDDDSCKFCTSFPQDDHILNKESLNGDVDNDQATLLLEDSYCDRTYEEPRVRENTRSSEDSFCTGVDVGANIANETTEDTASLVIRSKRKPKRRIISLSGENFAVCDAELLSRKLNGILDLGEAGIEDGLGHGTSGKKGLHNSYDKGKKQSCATEIKNHPLCGADNFLLKTRALSRTLDANEFVKSYFNENVADHRVSETCLQCTRCSCVLNRGSGSIEIEVAVLLSSERKFYTLVIDATHGNISEVIGCHRLEDINEVVIGIGLQILRVHIKKDSPYLFITRTIEKSRGLLCLFQICDSRETSNTCSLRSWEQVQVKLFEKDICGGMKLSIFQYSMLLFWPNINKGGSWLSRSVFVVEGYVLVCIEDFVQFSSLTDDVGVSSPYFSLDLCCPIRYISEMVIESQESMCVTLTLNHVITKVDFLAELGNKKLVREKTSSKSVIWKLRWFSEDTLLKFVALLKAIHLGITTSPLPVRCIS